jgi:hypothetical protein
MRNWARQNLLDSAGIAGLLADDTMIRLDWLISNALGGIKVWTRGKEASEARVAGGSYP